jgi:ABC-type lipoprotein export system ATPase subunit
MELTRGLACHRLDFRWPGKTDEEPWVLQAVEAVFPSGTVSLVTGNTGAGKSTFLHLLAGLLRPTAGEVWSDGQPVSRWPAGHRDTWRRQVGIVFQHLALASDLSVAENLLLPLIPREIAWSRMQADIDRQMVDADLSDLAGVPAGALSGGQRQRLAVARALVGRPRFILADEPTAFQDDAHTTRMGRQLNNAAREGAVVVICSHDPRLQESADIDQRFHLEAGNLTGGSTRRDAP